MGFRMVGMLGGSVFVENVFVIPGMGSLLVNAISMQDIPLIQGCVLLILSLIHISEPTRH